MALHRQIADGDRAALSRALTDVEYLTVEGRELLSASPKAEPRIIGWTGGAGAGKSSLLSAVIPYRKEARGPKSRIAVLAVDPTSPYSGGSMLGDRIRMDAHTLDSEVYIRSLPSRDKNRSLAPATMRMARFLASAGFDEVHIESVGVGQSDIETAEIADTAVVVVSPHTGDVIQGLKAGLLEAADLFVVSKSDLEGSTATAMSLENAVITGPNWTPPVLVTSMKKNVGIDKLSESLDQHFESISSSGERNELIVRRRGFEFRSALMSRLAKELETRPDFVALADEVMKGECTAFEAAERMMKNLGVNL